MDDKQFKVIVSKLDVLIRIIALTNTKDLTSTDKISLLSQAGLAPKEIAEIIGTTQNVVNVRLSQMRRKEGKHDKEKRD